MGLERGRLPPPDRSNGWESYGNQRHGHGEHDAPAGHVRRGQQRPGLPAQQRHDLGRELHNLSQLLGQRYGSGRHGGWRRHTPPPALRHQSADARLYRRGGWNDGLTDGRQLYPGPEPERAASSDFDQFNSRWWRLLQYARRRGLHAAQPAFLTTGAQPDPGNAAG